MEMWIPDWVDRICVWPVMMYRRHKYGYSFRKIRVGEEKLALVDMPDYYRFNNFQWSVNGRRERPYAVRFVFSSTGKLKTISMHREIMNFPVGRLIDHGNGYTAPR
jgi:hypothetical protein